MHTAGTLVASGSRITLGSNGGGGFGDPLERDPALVLRDVMNEVMSLDKARDVYGVAIVVVDRDRLIYEVDDDATSALRSQLRTRTRRRGTGPGEVHPFGERLGDPAARNTWHDPR